MKRIVAVIAALSVVLFVVSVMASGFGNDPHSVPFMMKGKPAPLFSIKRLDQEGQINLKDYAGQPVVLNFWATWCGPCKVEIPAFVELYDQYKDKGLVIVGVSVDDSPEQLQSFMKEFRMNYPVLQMTPEIETAFGPFYGYPTSFFIARDGTICVKHLGPATKEQFEREIKALL